jgi:uncharacterized protein YpuA (DUF1002 family)
MGYLVLGEDLTGEQTKAVLDFLKVEDMADYDVSYTTNKEEHAAFDDYLGADVVGSRALSSILLTPQEKGKGIRVSSYNITYCTVEMYQNALISAGVKDVDISIAAPVPVSGTCALLSAMNAYSIMSGEEIDEKAADAAVDELVTTGDLGEAIGDNDAAAELVAMVKQKMIEEDMSEDQLSRAIDQVSGKMGISVDSSTKEKVIDMLMKVKNTDVDVADLASQAAGLYSKISGTMKELNIQPREAAGFLEKLLRWALDLLHSFGIGQ